MNLLLLIEFIFSFNLYDLLFSIIIIVITFHITKITKASDKIKPKKKNKNSDDYPPYYPNGWLPVLESRTLKKGQVLPVFAFGNELIAFRGSSGKVSLLDAYCPHLGANLGVGGEVIENSIKCPFHGWVYGENGTCTHMTGTEASKLPKVQIKVWESLEVNGFIFVWNHSKGEKPNWFPQTLRNEKSLIFRGKSEYYAECHIQDIAENAADSVHMNELHSTPDMLWGSVTKNTVYDRLKSNLYWTWHLEWKPCPPLNQHMAETNMQIYFNLFGFKLFPSQVRIKMIGPAHSLLEISSKFIVNSRIDGFQSTISRGPLNHTIVHHFYSEKTSILGILILKFAINATIKQFGRDVLIWNSKKYLAKPFLAKDESSIKGFRLWYSQFYSLD